MAVLAQSQSCSLLTTPRVKVVVFKLKTSPDTARSVLCQQLFCVCAESQTLFTLDPLQFLRCCTFRIISALNFGLSVDTFSLQETQGFVASVNGYFKVKHLPSLPYMFR